MLGDPVALAGASGCAPGLARARPADRRRLRLGAPGRPAVAAAPPRVGLLQRLRPRDLRSSASRSARWPTPAGHPRDPADQDIMLRGGTIAGPGAVALRCGGTGRRVHRSAAGCAPARRGDAPAHDRPVALEPRDPDRRDAMSSRPAPGTSPVPVSRSRLVARGSSSSSADVDRLVAIGHPARREPSMTDVADRRSVQLVDPRHLEGQLRRIVAEEAVDAVADDLGQRPDATGDDRRPAGERLDRDQPERLRPRSRHQRRVATPRTAGRDRPARARRGTRPASRRPSIAGVKTLSK